jgi:serine/threonine-protein kinase
MSPEAGAPTANSDARSDLYSVGAVGYYLLTGQAVFVGETMEELCRKRLEEKPLPPAARIGRPICPYLEALILRCLEREPEQRPQSARELIALLAASPRITDWTIEQRAAWWTGHRESISQSRALAVEPLESNRAVDIEVEDRTP